MFPVIPYYRALSSLDHRSDRRVADTSRQEPRVVGDVVASAGRGMETFPPSVVCAAVELLLE